jgi:hypothetical protein
MNESYGRPLRIFETERVQEFLQMIEDGIDFNIAADSARLARSTIFDWLRKGRDIQNSLDESGELSLKDQAFLDFLERYMRARVASEVKAVENINKAIEKGSWRAAAWILEHRFPERWSLERVDGKSQIIEKPSGVVLNSELEAKVEAILKMRR